MKKMLKVLTGVLGVSAVVGAVCKKNTLNDIKNLISDSESLTDGIKYTAHTGCINTADNSLESIEAGVKYGADIVEFDIRFHNGEILLSHDEPVGGEVTLKEAFLKVKEYDNLMVNVDVKSTDQLHLVQEAAVEVGILDRIFFTGVFEADVETVKKECPSVPYYLNVNVNPKSKHTPQYLQSLVDKVQGCGAEGINFNKKSASRELVEAFHNAGLKVSIWTVSKDSDMYRILSYGPDNITTRRPDKMQRIMADVKNINRSE